MIEFSICLSKRYAGTDVGWFGFTAYLSNVLVQLLAIIVKAKNSIPICLLNFILVFFNVFK